MFGGTGGHFWPDSWILANIVQIGTQKFCQSFLNRTNDPCGRQFDQMTQAARSGCANNAEGSARRATSKEPDGDARGDVSERRWIPGEVDRHAGSGKSEAGGSAGVSGMWEAHDPSQSREWKKRG
jgi:hypothetical protein